VNPTNSKTDLEDTAVRPKSWNVDERGEVQGRIALKPADRYVEFVDTAQVVNPIAPPSPQS
jgi:hypothetical protein